MTAENRIRVGTRGSLLARRQTQYFTDLIHKFYPEVTVETVILHTQGDQMLNQPLTSFGGKGVFVDAFENALLQGEIDFAVHSAKDMPMELKKGCILAATLQRADTRDVLVLKEGRRLDEELLIGTGSLRRQSQLKELYPQMKCVSIRGNVPTRLGKITEGECQGVILAAAGMERLDLLKEKGFSYHYFSEEEMLCAGGQGIIAIEGREGNLWNEKIAALNDSSSYGELETERLILQKLNAGCHEPVGVLSRQQGEDISIRLFIERNGKRYKDQQHGSFQNRLRLAHDMAENALQYFHE